jgi:hypothetical protein
MENTAGTAVRDIFAIAALLVSVVFVSMLVKNAGSAGQLIKTSSNAFGGLLRSATLSDNTVTNNFQGSGFQLA